MKMYDAGKNIDIDDISILEKKLDKTFPSQYRVFLLQYNGGYPFPSTFNIQWKGQQWASGYDKGSVSDFYAINSETKSSNLLHRSLTLEGRIPSTTMAIAKAEGGDILLIGTGAHNAGKIYFWALSFETDDTEEADYSNIGFVADDFNQFMKNLYDNEN